MPPATAKAWLADGAEVAFLDVREAGEFGEGHPFLAVPLPYSRLELDVGALVPSRGTRVLLIDGGDGIAERAAAALAAMGYGDLAMVDGGTPGWAAAGYTLFKGVNLPSKTFGELAEQHYDTPHLSAAELGRRLAAGEKLVVIDGRPLAEFRKMSIPGAICCPNGELALRFPDLVPDGETTVVVNCAGRTRSIVGAQTLINLGVANPVFALQNGTQGWSLAGLPLAHGRAERYPDAASGAGLRDAAARLAADVPRLDAATLRAFAADPARTTYLLDVRTPEEADAAPYPGAVHAPGGQLVQSTDQYVGTRGARLVLVDGDGVRAPVVASWLAQLGHDVALAPPDALPPAAERPDPPRIAEIAPEMLAERLAHGGPRLVDLRPSADYRRGHVAAATWSIRPRLDRASTRPAVLIADDPGIAALAARDLAAPAVRLAGGPDDWRAAGLEVVETPHDPPDAERIDFLFFVHDRHDGNADAARKYLEWETGLVAQLDADERAVFRLSQPARTAP